MVALICPETAEVGMRPTGAMVPGAKEGVSDDYPGTQRFFLSCHKYSIPCLVEGP